MEPTIFALDSLFAKHPAFITILSPYPWLGAVAFSKVHVLGRAARRAAPLGLLASFKPWVLSYAAHFQSLAAAVQAHERRFQGQKPRVRAPTAPESAAGPCEGAEGLGLM